MLQIHRSLGKTSYIRQMPVWAGYVTLHKQNMNKIITPIMLNTDSFSMRRNIRLCVLCCQYLTASSMKPLKFKKCLETEMINCPAHAVSNYLTCCWTSAVHDDYLILTFLVTLYDYYF